MILIFLFQEDLSLEDGAATLTVFTANIIADQLSNFIVNNSSM